MLNIIVTLLRFRYNFGKRNGEKCAVIEAKSTGMDVMLDAEI